MTEKIVHYIESIHYDLEQTARLMRLLSVQLFEKLNISLSIDEYAALDTVSINAGICQRDLAKLILKDRANTGRILDSLEQKGFITRFIDTKNNRLVQKTGITEKGYKELKSITRKFSDYINSMTAAIDKEEVDSIQQSLRQFRKTLEKRVNMNI